MNRKKTLCQSCDHARRTPHGYVESCGLFQTPLQMYGQCVEATINGQCSNYAPSDAQK